LGLPTGSEANDTHLLGAGRYDRQGTHPGGRPTAVSRLGRAPVGHLQRLNSDLSPNKNHPGSLATLPQINRTRIHEHS